MTEEVHPSLAMTLDELRRRYEALPRIEELPWSRTFLGRCATWELFLENGPRVAVDMKDGGPLPEEEVRPDLAALIREAWPL